MSNKNKKMNALLLAICAVGLGNAQLWSWKKSESRTSEESISGAGSSRGSSMMEDPYMEEPYMVTGQEEMVQTPGFAGEEYYSDVEYREGARPGERKYKGLPLMRDVGVEPSREIREEKKGKSRSGGTKKTYKEKKEYGTGKEGKKGHKEKTKTEYTVERESNGGRKHKREHREHRAESRCRRCVRD